MKPALARAFWVACLGLIACAPHIASEATPQDAAEAIPGDSASSADAHEALERCLAEHGWATPPPAAPTARELAIRIAAVAARCQPPLAALERYAQELLGVPRAFARLRISAGPVTASVSTPE